MSPQALAPSQAFRDDTDTIPLFLLPFLACLAHLLSIHISVQISADASTHTTPTSSTSTNSSTSSLHDVLCEITAVTPHRPKGGRRKQLVGLGKRLTSDEALAQMKQHEEELATKATEREEKKREEERERKNQKGKDQS